MDFFFAGMNTCLSLNLNPYRDINLPSKSTGRWFQSMHTGRCGVSIEDLMTQRPACSLHQVGLIIFWWVGQAGYVLSRSIGIQTEDTESRRAIFSGRRPALASRFVREATNKTLNIHPAGAWCPAGISLSNDVETSVTLQVTLLLHFYDAYDWEQVKNVVLDLARKRRRRWRLQLRHTYSRAIHSCKKVCLIKSISYCIVWASCVPACQHAFFRNMRQCIMHLCNKVYLQ